MPFPSSGGKDLPLLEENSDLSILSVRDSSSGHEIEQAPVATGFQAHLFESKLDTLTNSVYVEDVEFFSASCSTAWSSLRF